MLMSQSNAGVVSYRWLCVQYECCFFFNIIGSSPVSFVSKNYIVKLNDPVGWLVGKSRVNIKLSVGKRFYILSVGIRCCFGPFVCMGKVCQYMFLPTGFVPTCHTRFMRETECILICAPGSVYTHTIDNKANISTIS